jgi:hypothetical protein
MADYLTDSTAHLENVSMPHSYAGVMVSSTFTDLRMHREALIKALSAQQLKPVTMELDSAKPLGDVIDSSLQMVKDSAAYIGIISHKYGQVPESSDRNPEGLSLTELEFREARRLRRPMLIFIMGDDHEVKPADVEKKPEQVMKLNAFRENAKRLHEHSSVHRVYKVFNNIHEFEIAAIHSVAELRRILDNGEGKTRKTPKTVTDSTGTLEPVPQAPTLYAAPPYIGSHTFVGRGEQLQTLNEWASHADPHSLLFYEAIGGAGKSILSWEWTTKYAERVRTDWAGRFWYSFYEKGATMVDFCRRAAAYMTGKPRETFRERNTAELTELLLQHLQNRPWLLILDGLERILVSYHRFDAAQLPDEHAGSLDTIASRDPCATINPEDEDLLRAFTAASPSKILITSRLVPRALLNRSSQPIPNVRGERLPGLRPADAESLIRSCGVTGDSEHIQDYLMAHCDCHPLVIGVLAGLITDYLPSRGNFEQWVMDPAGGGKLNLAQLGLVQKRNHILSCAFLALPESGRKLLATLALLSEAVDSTTLYALNPDLPSLEELAEPTIPDWWKFSLEERNKAREEYQMRRKLYEDYKRALLTRDEDIKAATEKLPETVKDLERRGLLQYDTVSKRYDLHPVVRGYAASGLKDEEINQYSQRVLDHFSQRPQNPYTQAKTLADFDTARLIVKALFQMGNLEKARDFIAGNNFLQVLSSKFEAHNEILMIIKPFFSQGWSVIPEVLVKRGAVAMSRRAAIALRRINAHEESYEVSTAALQLVIKRKRQLAPAQIIELAGTAGELNQLALEDRLLTYAEQVAILNDPKSNNVTLLLARLRQRSILGDFEGADYIWGKLAERKLSLQQRSIAAHHYAIHQFRQGKLNEDVLKHAEDINALDESALGMRNLIALRGAWFAERGDWENTRVWLQDAVARAHKVNKFDRRSEINLAIANYHLNRLPNAHEVAASLARDIQPWCQRHLAELWIALGRPDEAKKYAIAAYRWAWAEGEPFVRRNELEKANDLIHTLGIEPPILKSFEADEKRETTWELDLKQAIEEIQQRTQKERLAVSAEVMSEQPV